tara:strand:- start:1252 stop:1401 length:150 start_codon:yes stop_codon:yes gene_type:complete
MPKKKKKTIPKPLPKDMEDAILKNKENRKKIKVKIFETPAPEPKKKSRY